MSVSPFRRGSTEDDSGVHVAGVPLTPTGLLMNNSYARRGISDGLRGLREARGELDKLSGMMQHALNVFNSESKPVVDVHEAGRYLQLSDFVIRKVIAVGGQCAVLKADFIREKQKPKTCTSPKATDVCLLY